MSYKIVKWWFAYDLHINDDIHTLIYAVNTTKE